MKTTWFRFGAPILVLLCLAAALMWQYRLVNHLRAEIAALRDQLPHPAPAQPNTPPPPHEPGDAIPWSQREVNELMQLRARAARMQTIEQENTRLKSQLNQYETPPAPPAASAIVADQDTPEWQTMQGAMVITKGVGLALLSYAHGHGGEMPPDILEALESMDPGLFDRVHASGMPGGTAFESAGDIEFEMVFLGHLDDLGERSPSTVVMARQAEPVQLSNGRWARACVLGDGSSRVLVADSLDALTAEEASLTFTKAP